MTGIEIATEEECTVALQELHGLLDERPPVHSAKGRRLISLARGIRGFLVLHPGGSVILVALVDVIWEQCEVMLAAVESN